ncbi:MAG: hypothetical protein V3U35_05420 [Candidatus Neomarinimicrobiota bacterium]
MIQQAYQAAPLGPGPRGNRSAAKRSLPADLRSRLRRKLVLKATLFFVCLFGVGLVILLLDA